MFKIIEFNKDQKRIVVSHRAIHDEKNAEVKAAENASRDRDRDDTAKAVKRIKESAEKTTLGDLSALSNLKSEMEATEKRKPKKDETVNVEESSPEKKEDKSEQ